MSCVYCWQIGEKKTMLFTFTPLAYSVQSISVHARACLCAACGWPDLFFTHRRQSKEGNSQQSEARRQQPAWPRLRCLIPVANGSKSDLRIQRNVVKGQSLERHVRVPFKI